MEHENTGLFEAGIDEITKAHLLETARWTKFLAIIGFITVGFMLIGSFVIMVSGALFSSALSTTPLAGLGAVGLGILYLVFAALYLYPIISLYKFTTSIKTGLQTNNQELINEGFRHQKNMYRFFGILTIIVLAFYLIIIIFGGLGAMMG